MAMLPPLAQQALDLARRGDMAGAIAAAAPALAAHPDNYDLRLFLVRVHAQALDLDGALAHAREALKIAPGDGAARIELVRLLIGLDRVAEAEAELAQQPPLGPEGFRLQAMLLGRKGQPGKAIPILRQIVAADPRDFESWGMLGSCLLAIAQPGGAADAFAHAVALRPDIAKFNDKMIEAAVAAGRGEPLLAQARSAAAADSSPEASVTLARIAMLMLRHDEAETVLRDVLRRHPRDIPALLGLADVLERNNALDELGETVETIRSIDPAHERLPLLRARHALRTGRFAEALALAKAAPDVADRGGRHELIARAEERLGNYDAAFAAFEAMNADSEVSAQTTARRAALLRQLVEERTALMTPHWIGRWNTVRSDDRRRTPAFLIGFPRSGTTLLDTFLMGHPDVCIAEEKPLLQAVAEQIERYEDLGSLPDATIAALRDTYFNAVAAHVPDLGSRLLVDKYPLGAIDIAIIHRLFPDAKIVFAERHPFDVVMSCFATRFQPTPTLLSFSTLDDSAQLYDRVMALWRAAQAVIDLDVHPLQYELLIADPERAMRPLVGFLGLDWDEGAVMHERSAAQRGAVTSASYAQVSEPLHRRSIGRWRHYERHLAPVLPILRPWAEAMGYDV